MKDLNKREVNHMIIELNKHDDSFEAHKQIKEHGLRVVYASTSLINVMIFLASCRIRMFDDADKTLVETERSTRKGRIKVKHYLCISDSYSRYANTWELLRGLSLDFASIITAEREFQYKP